MARILRFLPLLALLLPAPARATTMVHLDFSELAWIADVVAEGTVLYEQAERAPGQEWLRTAVTVRLEHVIKGEAVEGDLLDVVEIGGRLGAEETRVPGAAVFAPGERVLLFLESRDGEWSCVGMSQGKLTLVAEAGSGRDVLVRVSLPRGLLRFDEAEVALPAVRLYADDLAWRLRREIEQGYVPPWRPIPGLPPGKAAVLVERGGDR